MSSGATADDETSPIGGISDRLLMRGSARERGTKLSETGRPASLSDR